MDIEDKDIEFFKNRMSKISKIGSVESEKSIEPDKLIKSKIPKHVVRSKKQEYLFEMYENCNNMNEIIHEMMNESCRKELEILHKTGSYRGPDVRRFIKDKFDYDKQKGFFSKIFYKIISFFKSKKKSKKKFHMFDNNKRLYILSEKISKLFNSSDQYPSIDFNSVFFNIITDTNSSNIKKNINNGETEEDAIRRISDEYLASYRSSLSNQKFPSANEYVSENIKINSEMIDKNDSGATDPLLEYAKKERLNEILSKNNITSKEKKIIEEETSGKDIITMD